VPVPNGFHQLKMIPQQCGNVKFFCCRGPSVCSSGSPDPERVRPSPYGTSKKTPPHRSAGACPPHGSTNARDRPSPYGNREPLSVVRDRLIPNGIKKTSPHRSAGACPPHRSTNARDRPSPYGNREPLSVVRDRLIPNGLTKKRHPTVARGPVPRIARRRRGTGPRTTVIGNRSL